MRHAQPEHCWKEGKMYSAIVLFFYDNDFGCEDFLRIIDWMPYIVELDFEGNTLVRKQEHCYEEKEFKEKQRVDKK